MYIYVYIYTCVYIYVYIYIYLRTACAPCCLSPICAAFECDVSYVYIRLCVYIYTRTHVYIYTYIHKYMYLYISHRLRRLLFESNLRGVGV